MGIREVLVFLDTTPASDGRLHLAAWLAAEQEAELSAVFVHDDQVTDSTSTPALPSWGLVAQLIPGTIAIQRSAVAAEASERGFHECLRSFGLSGDWHYANRRDFPRLVGLAQAADLIVVGQVDPNVRSAPRWRPNETVMESGRPTLVVPYAGAFPRVGRRVLVAWNGSAHAARALHDALPIMRNAHSVTVLTVRDRDDDLRHGREATARVIRHLQKHGIAAQSDHPVRVACSISDVVLSAAMDQSIDLIVAGGCYHAHLHEALLGSTGRQLLQTMTVPLLTAQ